MQLGILVRQNLWKAGDAQFATVFGVDGVLESPSNANAVQLPKDFKYFRMKELKAIQTQIVLRVRWENSFTFGRIIC
jgi:hypothetical protein